MKKISINHFFILLALSIFSSFSHGDATEISGAQVINDNCARCHNARPVHEFSMQEWQVIMPHMREKAHLSKQETDAVLRFFETIQSDNTPPDTVKTETLSGRELMTKFGCVGCHSIKGEGGDIGPSLDNIIGSKGEKFVKQKLVNPQFNNPASPMPKMNLSDDQIALMIEFLKQ
ncbi:MAG: c-type cytochrome [Pseudomonadales bacterium]|nr:c-type cytochrome [Pseudomonadales bacterium]